MLKYHNNIKMSNKDLTIKELPNPTISKDDSADDYQFIFAHIPRTGGKTMNHVIRNNCKDRLVFTHHFNETKEIYNQNLKSLKKKIITIIRNPITRIISEWVSYGMSFTNVSNIYDYINCDNRKNNMCKFLLGYHIYDNIEINISHFNTIKNLIITKYLVVGIFEDWNMIPIYNLLDIPNTENNIRPSTIDSYQLEHIWIKIKNDIIIDDKLKHNIRKNNEFDVLLYTFVSNLQL
jgi:hypothetical protein